MSLLHRVRPVLTMVISVIVVGLSACSSTTPQAPVSEPDDIAWLQKAGNLSVTFSAMMTFNLTGDYSESTFTFPSELGVPAVPITWMGNIFNGVVQDGEPGNSLIDKVHGSVSPDGAWINEMSFSREVVRQTEGSYYQVTLRSVPIIKVEGENTAVLASFVKKGTDVRKHIAKIEYTSGSMVVGGTPLISTYTSTDWDDADGILSLKVEFATGTGERQMGGGQIGGGM